MNFRKLLQWHSAATRELTMLRKTLRPPLAKLNPPPVGTGRGSTSAPVLVIRTTSRTSKMAPASMRTFWILESKPHTANSKVERPRTLIWCGGITPMATTATDTALLWPAFSVAFPLDPLRSCDCTAFVLAIAAASPRRRRSFRESIG